jgi:hypothetical protein
MLDGWHAPRSVSAAPHCCVSAGLSNKLMQSIPLSPHCASATAWQSAVTGGGGVPFRRQAASASRWVLQPAIVNSNSPVHVMFGVVPAQFTRSSSSD